MIGRRLTPTEVDAYDLVALHLRVNARIIQIPFIPGGYAGITFGTWIFLTKQVPTDGTSTLMAHELVHVRQYAEQGVLRYLARYLGSFFPGLFRLRNWNDAYEAIPAEVDARQRTTAWLNERMTSPDDPTML